MKPGQAQYSGADWSKKLSVLPSGDVETCKATCEENPSCAFFFFNARGGLALGKPGQDSAAQDCVFFTGGVWAGAAPQSDLYIKLVGGKPAGESP